MSVSVRRSTDAETGPCLGLCAARACALVRARARARSRYAVRVKELGGGGGFAGAAALRSVEDDMRRVRSQKKLFERLEEVRRPRDSQVQRLLFRANVPERAKHYGTVFLNQARRPAAVCVCVCVCVYLCLCLCLCLC